MQQVPDVPPRAAGLNRTAVIAIAVGSALVVLTVAAVVILLISFLRPPADTAINDRDDDRSSSEEADAADDEEDEEHESDAPLTSDLSGLWTGDVSGDNNPYSLRVTIKDDGNVATAIAEYPEIPCTGTWSLSSRTDEEVVFVEKMPLENVCYDQVVIHLTLNDDGSLSYSAVSGSYDISSTLVRQD